jgi:hypothetical protein
LHGAALEVSRDNATVRRFEEPATTAGGIGGGSGGGLSDDGMAAAAGEDTEPEVDPTEPTTITEGALALPRPGRSTAEASNVAWALKELYAALPLSTCVPLDDAVSMLPSQMRDAAATCPDLVAEIRRYPDYFTVWRSPDDELAAKTPAAATTQQPRPTFIVQRTMLGKPEVDLDEVARCVAALVPQGGVDAEKLMRRLPPKVQRYLFHNGLKTTLAKRPDDFVVVGDRVLSIAVRA